MQRIGLSATQRPLDEVAKFLGGSEMGERGWAPRPVTIVDAGMVKPIDLKVITAVDDFGELPGGSIWPAIICHAGIDAIGFALTVFIRNSYPELLQV